MNRLIILCIVTVVSLTALTAGAIEGELTGQAQMRVAYPYVWRGVLTTDGAVVQPEVTLALNGFTLNAWGTWDWEGTEETSARTRVDLSVDYKRQTERCSIRGGFIFYAYHDDHAKLATDTYELLAEVSLHTRFNPSLTVFYDFGTVDGVYAVLGASDTFEAFDWGDIVVQAQLGLADEKYKQITFGAVGNEEVGAGLVDLRLSASLYMFLTPQWSLVPEVEYISLVDSDLRTLVEDAGEDADQVVGSLAAVCMF